LTNKKSSVIINTR